MSKMVKFKQITVKIHLSSPKFTNTVNIDLQFMNEKFREKIKRFSKAVRIVLMEWIFLSYLFLNHKEEEFSYSTNMTPIKR